MMSDVTFWAIAILYSILQYFYGHQGSHVAHMAAGNANLSPTLTSVLLIYNWLFFLPWIAIGWYGYKVGWKPAVLVLVLGWGLRLIWTKIGIETGAIRSAWAISLIGIPLIPLLLFAIVELVSQIPS